MTAVRTSNVVRIGSGGSIDVDYPDFSACKSIDDFIDVKCLLMEKIIDIELQIDLHQIESRTDDRTWLPRANAALKYAKMYRDECQNRQGAFSEKIRQDRQARIDRQIIDCTKCMLPKEAFDKIVEVAVLKASSTVDK
jgi:hypothetical protein